MKLRHGAGKIGITATFRWPYYVAIAKSLVAAAAHEAGIQ